MQDRSLGWEGHGKPLHYSCLEDSKDRGAWRATVHGVAKESDMTQQLNNISPFRIKIHPCFTSANIWQLC